MIVSTPQELPFVLMNLLELEGLYDSFLITESNISHNGDIKEYEFKDTFNEFISGRFRSAEYIEMDLSSKRRLGEASNDDNRLFNAHLIRNEFINFYPLVDGDIIIGLEGDEVLYRSRELRAMIKLAKVAHKFGKPLAYTLTLNQFSSYLNLFQRGVEYYGPSIGNFLFFKRLDFANFKYEGRRIFRPLGCHFSWIMSDEEIIKKRNRFAHRQENGPTWIAEEASTIRKNMAVVRHQHRRKLRENVIVNNCENNLYPRSLRLVREQINEESILMAPWFWESS